MPTYGENNFKESNVNYLNKDFAALKQSLMNYAKSYFPDTYRDFNETSPGMMLMEMNAYVGDVLSFYIDKQYQEMILPLSEERRNIVNMAKMFGYKVKPIVPAFVDLTFKSNVTASSNHSSVNYANAGIFDSGIEISADSNADIVFSTLEPIDFSITGSNDTDVINQTNQAGLATEYTLTRKVRAVSATEKTITFQIANPEKFKRITIPDTNVVDIISCIDSQNNNWYEVDFLAQDKVPISKHYTDEQSRTDAYMSENSLRASSAVPYSLSYITTTKRFTRETNLDNTTSLVFGNGILNNGQVVDTSFIDMEQVGIIIPGQSNDLNQSIDPLLGDEYSTLGETPNNTTLTITYRVGGGVVSNIPVGNLTTTPTLTAQNGNTAATLTSVTNESPARGGRDEQTISELRENIKAFFATQNRCVTKEDYEARVMNMPAKYGNIAKVYVARSTDGDVPAGASEFNAALASVMGGLGGLQGNLSALQSLTTQISVAPDLNTALLLNQALSTYINEYIVSNINFAESNVLTLQEYFGDLTVFELSGIKIYVLGYDNSRQLVGNPHANTMGLNNNLPITLLNNISNYLSNFRILTDVVSLHDGYIVNFAVFFDVVAEKYADKQEVKLRCIQKIKDYFRIEKMQFNQPIFKGNLEYELMGIEGVRSIGHITITQTNDYLGDGQDLDQYTYTYQFNPQNESGVDIDGDGTPDGVFAEGQSGTSGYGYKYDFANAQSSDGTIIMPPNTATPTVFELKNPNRNIQGRVR